MPISWNEIKSRALAFSKEWKDETSEGAESQSFWNGFFNVFGVARRRVATFEKQVDKLGNKSGYIDLFWPGKLIVEQKSKGKDLEKAFHQALDYTQNLKKKEFPEYIIVSDFAHFKLYDLEKNEEHEFSLEDLHKNVELLGFIAGYEKHEIKDQDPVNIHAAEMMGALHDQMKEVGYEGHQLEIYLVRLLFCLFAEDTGIFEIQQFIEYIEDKTNEDGSDLAHHLNSLFYVLNTPHNKRLKNLDEQLAKFPYVNGKLFEEMLPPAGFDSSMRKALLECCALDWSKISPAIFGSLFQSIMDKKARRNLGAHYTSEKNILKLIKPLFLDELWEEFHKVKRNKNKLFEFHKKLRRLNFLDPACGCGNFLVIAYRELRLLELEILKASGDSRQQVWNIHSMIQLDVDQFYGIEIEEFPAQIAQVAMWLMDHQMNMLVSKEFGMYFARIPLKSTANIVCDNALRIDWNDVIPAERLSFIMGNPPFVGKSLQSATQKSDMSFAFDNRVKISTLDFVSAWYYKSAKMMEQNPEILSALVSTNSITQGEQVPNLWKILFDEGISIFFAHRTFQWNSEARGKAAVHCVIVGFSKKDISKKYIFEYEDIKGEPHLIQAKNINPYLVEAGNLFLNNISNPVIEVPKIVFGNMPNDGGWLLLSDDEKNDFLRSEPNAEKWIKPFLGAREFLNNQKRWCLWLVDISPKELRLLDLLKERVEKVKETRAQSSRESTKRLAATPTLFGEIRQPKSEYILIPAHSSENRRYIPFGFMEKDFIVGNSCFAMENANLYIFGVLNSSTHMSWVRTVCGRIKSDYRYSAGIVYNNFPWPENPTEKKKEKIEKCAQAVLDARAEFPDASLADLYDPLTMPPVLLKAHHALDKAVDAAYGKTNFKTEAERVAFLFEMYEKYCEKIGK